MRASDEILNVIDPLTEAEEIKAAKNVLDSLDAEINPKLYLYAYMNVLAALGLTHEDFYPDQMWEKGLNDYMELFE